MYRVHVYYPEELGVGLCGRHDYFPDYPDGLAGPFYSQIQATSPQRRHGAYIYSRYKALFLL
jgi:hypothetical protein